MAVTIMSVTKKVAVLCTAFIVSTLAWADDYAFDTAHTQVFFTLNHMGFSNSTGQFTEFDGGFTFDAKDFSKSSVEVSIDIASLDLSNHEKWRGHVIGEDFFDAEAHPKMTFKSTAVKKTGDDTFAVTGDLTIKGVTKPTVLNVKFNKAGEAFGKEKAGFSATTTIDRTEFGVDAYAPAVGAEVEIRIEVEGEKVTS